VHTGASVTDQGLIEGQAAETLRLREALGAGPTGPTPVALFADVHVKHARPLGTEDIGQAASDAADRALADALIVSGIATGSAPDAAALEAVWALVPGVPLFLGSGLTVENCGTLGAHLRGAIVGSATQANGKAGNPVELDRARAIVDAFKG
jgi:membrane complex biogenesis BtpA family protein